MNKDSITYYLNNTISISEFNEAKKKYNIQDSELAFICHQNIKYHNNKNYKNVCPNEWIYSKTKKSSLKYTTTESLLYKLFLIKNGYLVLPFSFVLGLVSVYYLFATKKEKQVVKKISSIKIPLKKVQGYIDILEEHYSK